MGTWKAYLVHSYRDEQGRPRHKTLAYLGHNPEIKPDHLEKLQERHAHLPIRWEKIKPAGAPPRLDASKMSDQELLRNIRSLRREHGIQSRMMYHVLREAGVPPCSKDVHIWGNQRDLYGKNYGKLERALAEGKEQDFYEDPIRELAPVLRKVFCSA